MNWSNDKKWAASFINDGPGIHKSFDYRNKFNRMTELSTYLTLKDNIYKIINEASPPGITQKDLEDKIGEYGKEDFSNAIECLIVNNYIRAYHPDGSNEHYYQTIKK